MTCAPSPVPTGSEATCTATVTGRSPAGTVTWASSGIANFSPESTCISPPARAPSATRQRALRRRSQSRHSIPVIETTPTAQGCSHWGSGQPRLRPSRPPLRPPATSTASTTSSTPSTSSVTTSSPSSARLSSPSTSSALHREFVHGRTRYRCDSADDGRLIPKGKTSDSIQSLMLAQVPTSPGHQQSERGSPSSPTFILAAWCRPSLNQPVRYPPLSDDRRVHPHEIRTDFRKLRLQ